MLTSPRHSGAGARAAAVTGLLLVTLTACGADPGDAPNAAVGLSTSPKSSASVTPTPSESTKPSPPEESSTAKSSSGQPLGRSRDLSTRLLAAADMPGPNGSFRWKEVETTSAQPDDLASCLSYPMTSIGAQEVRFREFAPATSVKGERDAYAGTVVGQFPDRMTARRARAVLISMHDHCEERLVEAGRKGDVAALETVTGTAGRAAWFLTTLPLKKSDSAVLEATGFVKVRDRIAVVVMRHEGQDYDYPTGEEPLVEALRLAGALLRD